MIYDVNNLFEKCCLQQTSAANSAKHHVACSTPTTCEATTQCMSYADAWIRCAAFSGGRFGCARDGATIFNLTTVGFK